MSPETQLAMTDPQVLYLIGAAVFVLLVVVNEVQCLRRPRR